MIHAAIYSAVALILLTVVGNWLCRGLFVATGLTTASASKDTPATGRIIGSLERLVLAIGIATHSWEILAAVIALKTVARFKELDDKTFAEYFLVGSLFSVLWAVIVTSGWLAYDTTFGLDLSGQIADVFGSAASK